MSYGALHKLRVSTMQIELMHVKVVPGRLTHGESTLSTVWGSRC
jgi:hypothetical protein